MATDPHKYGGALWTQELRNLGDTLNKTLDRFLGAPSKPSYLEFSQDPYGDLAADRIYHQAQGMMLQARIREFREKHLAPERRERVFLEAEGQGPHNPFAQGVWKEKRDLEKEEEEKGENQHPKKREKFVEVKDGNYAARMGRKDERFFGDAADDGEEGKSAQKQTLFS